MARAKATASTPSSASGAATIAATLQRAEAVRGLWRDAVVAKLTKGWAKLQEMVPTQAKSIDLIADAGVEAADAGILKVADLAIAALNEKKGAMTAGTRKEADRVLGQMKGALISRGGRVDPASEKAIGVIQDALSLPLEKVTDPARRAVYSAVREGLRGSDALRQVTDLYYKLDATAKAIVTMVVAGGLAASQVPNYITVKDGVLSVRAPSFLLPKIPAIGQFGLTSFSITGKTLNNVGGSWSRAVGPGTLTLATTYRRGLTPSAPEITSSARWVDHGTDVRTSFETAEGRKAAEASVARSGVGVKTSWEMERARQAAAASVTTQTQLPGRFAPTVSTEAGVTATTTAPRSARDIALGLRGRADVMAPVVPIGRKGGGLSAGGYAQVDLPPGAAPSYQTGVKATGTFGATARPTRAERRAERQADRFEARTARKEARAEHVASRRPHGNLRVAKAIAGPIPAVEALVADPTIPALEPTPAQAPPAVSGTTIAVGAVALAAALGGWWWWTHRAAGGAAVAQEDLDVFDA